MNFKLSLKKTATVLILISLIGKIFGFARELLLANYFGTSRIVDAFLMSVTIPSILFGFLPAVGVGITPIYYGIKEKTKRNQFISNAIIASTIVSLLCITLTMLLSKQIVSICAPGFSDADKTLTSQFLYITVWCVLFNTPVQILTAFLNCNQDYINSNLSNLFVSITQAVFVVIAAKTKAIFLPIGIVMPWIFQYVWLLHSSQRKGFHFEKYKGKDANIKELLIISIPLFFSNILVDINGFVDKLLSSSLDEGMLSALNYSFTLRAVFITAASTVITTMLYPRIAEKVKEKEDNKICSLIEKYLDYISFIVIPITMLCIIFAKDIVSVVLMRGQFDQRSVDSTTRPFIMYTLSLTIIIWRDLIIKVMYAYGQTKRNLIFSLIEVAINVCISLVLVRQLGHTGLALATTIAVMMTFPLYLKNLCNTVTGLSLKGPMKKAFKEIIAAGVMVIVSLAFSNYIIHPLLGGEALAFVKLILAGCAGIICYVFISYVLGIEECKVLIWLIKNRLNKRYK